MAADVAPGDQLLVADGDAVVPSEVRGVRDVVAQGLYAPLVHSGRPVVDGVVVSSFASSPRAEQERRCVAFASLLGVRPSDVVRASHPLALLNAPIKFSAVSAPSENCRKIRREKMIIYLEVCKQIKSESGFP